jgi:dTDP-4-amino-4,6-dideoxygalactose transaminase
MKIEVYSPTIRRKEMDAVLTAMVEDRIGPGDHAKFLVQTAREKIKFDYCLSLRSPAIALYLALKSLNLEKRQGVLISALSPLYYGRVIEDLDLVPHYCDVNASTGCVSRETVLKALEDSQNIRCMILHHTLGFIPDADAVSEFGLPVIEDCSKSYGTEMEMGERSTTVFTPVLTILGLEERDVLTSGGGALLYSANRRDSAMLRGLSDLPPEYGLPDMNAALAVVQFKEAAKNLSKRREIAELYTQSAIRTRHRMFIRQEKEYNNYAFPLILETGVNEVKAYSRRKDIVVESAFENTLAGSGVVPPEKCPHAYSLSLRTVLFPLYPRLGMAKAGKVAKLIMTLP